MTPPPSERRTHEHPLLGLFLDAAGGRFPPPDGQVSWLDELLDGRGAVIAFTGTTHRAG